MYVRCSDRSRASRQDTRAPDGTGTLGRDGRMGGRDRARVPRRAQHEDQDVLRVPQRVRRRAQHEHVSGVPGLPRLAAGSQRARGGVRAASCEIGLALDCAIATALARSTARTTSIRTCRRTTRSPSTTCRSASTGHARRRPARWLDRARRHHAGAHGGGHRQDHPRAGAGRIHERDHALVDYNRAGVPLIEFVSEPDIRTPRRRAPIVQELRSMLAGARRLRREDGGGLDAHRRERVAASGRQRRARHEGRDQEHELDPVARTGARPTRSCGRRRLLEDGERVVQETRHWDEGAGATQLDAQRRKRRTTTATSPSRTSPRSSRATNGSRRSARRSPSSPALGRRGTSTGWA